VTGEPDVQRSSCEIKTSVRGADIGVKVYSGSPVEAACRDALKAYFWVFDEVEAQLLGRKQRV
jgi:hypothetical protein